MTWSQLAGDRIDQFRNAVGWITPAVSLKLDTNLGTTSHEAHHEHGEMAMEPNAVPVGSYIDQFDEVNRVSREAGIDSAMLEIRPPRAADQAWLVREYDRSWPTQVDTIAIDPRDMKVISRADFETFPLIAKLIRWGIDIHMGVLFGIANQIVMVLLGVSIITMIIYGYRIWWQRRPPAGAMPRTLIQSWSRLTVAYRVSIVVTAVVIGWALPMIGFSLILFLLADLCRWKMTPKTSSAV